ncbi:hypothetical protein V6N13_067742 [Hibiscus sabdariffa]
MVRLTYHAHPYRSSSHPNHGVILAPQGGVGGHSISFQVPIAWTLTIPDSRAKEVDHLKNHRTTTRRKREPSTGKLDLKSRPCSSNLGMQYQFLIRRCNSSAAST